jgi:hypothetical protein
MCGGLRSRRIYRIRDPPPSIGIMDVKSPQTIWASVTVVFIMVGSATTLVALGKDVTVILALAGLVAVPVLGAFGVAVYQKLDQVKESSNGNLSKVLEMQQKTQDQLTFLAMSMTPRQTQSAMEEAKDEEKREAVW